MSGGDSTGGIGIFTPEENCDDLFIKVRLSSVVEEVLKNISLRTELDIVKEGGSVVAKHGGNIAGSIASRDVIKLLKCIEEGKQYTGFVMEINDGKCVVQISKKKK